ncbi:hypothetical protein [Candidatus Uabimicrobium sp. HlEnr_7]|uniref:hypothetical protein n=1 Tax=Candidatus Uabimicrobium helgolandensis TaxID=3095367 RepID=UPI0035583E6C
MDRDHQIEKFFWYLNKLKYYNLIDVVLKKAIIVSILSLFIIFFYPYLCFVLFVIFFLPKYCDSTQHLAKNYDYRYYCNESICSAYHIIIESNTNPFSNQIISHAQLELDKNFPQEKLRFRKLFLQKILSLCFVVLIISILLTPHTRSNTTREQKKLLAISAKNMMKIAKNIEQASDKEASFLKSLAKSWLNSNTKKQDIAKSTKNLKKRKQKIDQTIRSMKKTVISIEKDLSNWQQKDKLLSKTSDETSPEVYEKIKNFLQEGSPLKALQAYKNWLRILEKQSSAIQKATHLAGKLNDKLQGKSVTRSFLNGDPFEIDEPQKKLVLTKSSKNAFSTMQGWEKIEYPSKYNAVVHSYLNERLKNEEK